MRGVWEKYYTEASAVVFVVDSADPDRLAEVKQVFGKYMHLNCVWVVFHSSITRIICFAVVESTCAAESLANVPILVFANKQDLPVSIVLT